MQALKKVFISHNNSKGKYAKKLAKYLEERSFKAWYAPRDISAGSMWDERIPDGIKECDVVVLLFCEKSNESKHVRTELELAMRYRKHVICMRVEDVMPHGMEYFLSTRQWIDWMKFYEEKPINELIKFLKDPSRLENPKGWYNPLARFIPYIVPIFILLMPALLFMYLYFTTEVIILDAEERYELAMQSISNMDSDTYRNYIKRDEVDMSKLDELVNGSKILAVLYRQNYSRDDSKFNYETLINILSDLGYFYRELGSFPEQASCYEEILKLVDNKYYENEKFADRDRITYCEKISTAKRGSGNLSEAMKYSQTELELKRKLAKGNEDLIETQEDFIESYIDISTIALELGNLTEARKYAEEGLKLILNIVNEDDDIENSTIAARVYQIMAEVTKVEGNIDEAADFYLKAIELFQDAAGEENTIESLRELAKCNSSLGEVLLVQGKLADAEKVFGDYSKLAEEILEYSDDIHDYRLMMQAYVKQGKLAIKLNKLHEAKNFFKKAASVNEDVVNSTHNLIDTMNMSAAYGYIGDICFENGELDEAENYYMKAINYEEELERKTNDIYLRRGLAVLYSRMGNIRHKTGKLEDEKKYLEKCLEVIKKLADETKLTQDVIMLSGCYIFLGDLASTQGKTSEAIDYLSKSIEINIGLLGNTSDVEAYRSLAQSYNSMAVILLHASRYTEAQEYYNKALDKLKSLIVRTGSLEDRQEAAKCYESIGLCLRLQGKSEEAEKYFTQASEARSKIAASSGVQGTHKDSFSDSFYCAQMSLEQYDAGGAEKFFTDAMNANREHSEGLGTFQNRINNIDALGGLGDTAMLRGDVQKAGTYYNGVVAASRKLVKDTDMITAKRILLQSLRALISFTEKFGQSNERKNLDNLYKEFIKTGEEIADATNNANDIAYFIRICSSMGLKFDNFYEAKNIIDKGINRGIPLLSDDEAVKLVRFPIALCYNNLALIYILYLEEEIAFYYHIKSAADALVSILDEPFNAENIKEYELFTAYSTLFCSWLLECFVLNADNLSVISSFPIKKTLPNILKILEPMTEVANTFDNRVNLSWIYYLMGIIAKVEGETKQANKYYAKSISIIKGISSEHIRRNTKNTNKHELRLNIADDLAESFYYMGISELFSRDERIRQIKIAMQIYNVFVKLPDTSESLKTEIKQMLSLCKEELNKLSKGTK